LNEGLNKYKLIRNFETEMGVQYDKFVVRVDKAALFSRIAPLKKMVEDDLRNLIWTCQVTYDHTVSRDREFSSLVNKLDAASRLILLDMMNLSQSPNLFLF
jgi:hypothetical protein